MKANQGKDQILVAALKLQMLIVALNIEEMKNKEQEDSHWL